MSGRAAASAGSKTSRSSSPECCATHIPCPSIGSDDDPCPSHAGEEPPLSLSWSMISPLGFVSISDAPSGEVVRREREGDAVALQNPDLELRHLASTVGQDDVPVLELYPVHPVG